MFILILLATHSVGFLQKLWGDLPALTEDKEYGVSSFFVHLSLKWLSGFMENFQVLKISGSLIA